MKNLYYKPINAEEKLKSDKIHYYGKQLKEIKEKVDPKSSQCIVLDGYIIIEGDYNPDLTVTCKIPRTVDYGFDTFPIQLQQEIKKLQEELKLTKDQINQMKKFIKGLDLKIMDLNKQLEIIRNKAVSLNEEKKKQNQIDNFFKKYEAFFECLTSQLKTFDSDTKNNIKVNLNNMVEVINDVVKNL